MATIEELKAQKNQLLKEYEAIQAEFSAGKNFTSGAAEIDRERREIAKYQEIKAINQQIRAQEGQISAAGQTAESAANNNISTPISGAGTGTQDSNEVPLDSKETARLQNTAKADNGDETDPAQTASSNTNTNESVHVDVTGGITNESEAASAGQVTELSGSGANLYNRLHDYTSYSYRITLWLLTDSDYTSLTDSPSTFEPKRALISTGGGIGNLTSASVEVSSGGSSSKVDWPKRHPDFAEDFYFENLMINTVVGLNAKTKASNAVEISFTIVEPYGLSLLDRLMSACMYPDGPTGQPSGTANYVEQPYLLQIDFLSNPDEAKSNENLITTKKLAIKITEIKIKPGPGGTEYRCRAIPFNHSAFQQTVASCPVNLSVTAATVEEYFDSTDTLSKIFDATTNITDERVESELKKWEQNWAGDNPPTIDEVNLQREKIKSSLTYTVKSLPAAYNSYMEGLAKSKRFALPPNLINVYIDDAFKKSLLVDETRQDSKNVPLTDKNKSFSLSTAQGAEKANYKSTSIFNIHQGTDIPSLIDRVLMSSTYIRNQVEDLQKNIEEISQQQTETNAQIANGQLQASQSNRNADLQKNKFIDWYKIIPQVYLNGFDNIANAWSKVVNYVVIPYKFPNAYHPDFKKTKIPESKIVREYNYLYTGLNQDIISLEVDFNATYYTAIGTYQKEKIRGKNFAGADVEIVGNELQASSVNQSTQSTIPVSLRPVNNPSQESTYKLNQDPKDFSVASLAKSIYSSSRGDMLNLKLRIAGDPSFIKQDDIYYNPMSPEYRDYIPNPSESAPPINPFTGQIIFDAEQVFVRLNILNAVDIDDSTGITNKQIKLSNGRSTNGTFSGVYRILQVRNEFNRGKFEQTLEMVRMPDEIVENANVPQSNGKTASVLGTKKFDEADGNIISSTQPVVETDNTDTPDRPSQELVIAGRINASIVDQPSEAAQERPQPQIFI